MDIPETVLHKHSKNSDTVLYKLECILYTPEVYISMLIFPRKNYESQKVKLYRSHNRSSGPPISY